MLARCQLLLQLLLLPYLVLGAPTIINTSIACDKTDFLLKIKFNETFHGSIFTQKGDPNCVYVNGTLQPDENYQIKIPLNGCETHENKEGHLENEIVVQQSNHFDVATDKKFLLTCIPAAPIFRDSQVTLSFGGITIDSEATTASTLENKAKVDYEVKVLDGEDLASKPLTRPLSVGDKVTYMVELRGEMKSRIGRCWANDGKSELPLSDSQGCSLQRAGDVWGDFEVIRHHDRTSFMNHIKAWAFPTSNEVNIFCNLHVCATCEQTNCRDRQRRTPGLPGDPPGMRDPFSAPIDTSDISPPIPIRTSFRLKRESNVATMRPQNVGTSSEGANSSSFVGFYTVILVFFVVTTIVFHL